MTRRDLFNRLLGCLGFAAIPTAVTAPVKFGLVDGDLNPFGWMGKAYLNGKEEPDCICGDDVRGWMERYARAENGERMFARQAWELAPGQFIRGSQIVERVYGDVRFELTHPEAFLEYRKWLVESMTV